MAVVQLRGVWLRTLLDRTVSTVLRRLFDEHLALLLSTLAATTIIAKVWTVAHGGLSGIAALISSGGLTSLIGALLAGLPAVGTACVLAAGVFLPEAIREGDKLRGPIVGTATALLVGLALAPQRWFVLGVVLFVVSTMSSLAIVAGRHRRTGTTSGRLPFLLRKSPLVQDVPPIAALALIALLGWAAVASSDRPWIPPEDVTTRTDGTVTGYVLKESSGLVVMRELDRSVVRIAEDDILDRTICTTDTRSQRSLLSNLFWADEPVYPACDGQ